MHIKICLNMVKLKALKTGSSNQYCSPRTDKSSKRCMLLLCNFDTKHLFRKSESPLTINRVYFAKSVPKSSKIFTVFVSFEGEVSTTKIIVTVVEIIENKTIMVLLFFK